MSSIIPAYAGTGLRRRSSIRPSIFSNKLLGTPTPANWNVTYLPWRTILVPIFTSFFRNVVSDQCATSSGEANVRMPEAVGVVHVLVAAEPSKRGLTKQTGHPVLTVLPSPRVYKPLPGGGCQSEGIVKFPIGKKPSIGRDLGTVEFQLQAAVKTDPQRGLFAFTRRVT